MPFFRKSSLEEVTQSAAYAVHVSKMEQRDIERAFARLFSSDDGKNVLAWLQVATFHRALPLQTTDEQLRFCEGQRHLMATILRMIDRGRNN